MDHHLKENRFTSGMFLMTGVWVGLFSYMSLRALVG
jgi:hypothetical protein